MTDVAVQSVGVDPNDTALGTVRHLLHDTRHRDVTYTATAVSRFHSYFPGTADADLAAVPLVGAVDVPSTARPAPPVVASVVPAFEWQQTLGPTLTRTRSGNRIRVELARPWFSSGDDERLALVMSTVDSDGTPGTTQVGQDPIWWTGACARWPLASAAVPSGDPTVRVTTVNGVAVDVVPAEVFFDAAAGRWFADVALPGVAGRSYAPLVRPALARYQRHSLPGCELSPVVLGDFVPLLPDRTLTVTVNPTTTLPDAGTVVVTLSGLGPDGPWPNRVDAVIEAQRGEGSDLTIVEDNVYAPAPTGWVAVQVNGGRDPVQSGPLGTPLELSLPPGDLSRYRLRVHEAEVTPGKQMETTMSTFGEMEERIVFADTVPLNWNAPSN